MNIIKIDKRVASAFSNVKKDLISLRKYSDERFITREDYVKLFTEFSKLRKEHYELIEEIREENIRSTDEIRKKLEDTTKDINKNMAKQFKESNKRNDQLAKITEKERTNRSEVKEVGKLRKDIENMRKMNYKEIKKVADDVRYLMENSVDVNDVENNFITRKKVDDKLDKIKKKIINKKEAEETHNELHNKINSIKTELDDMNEIIKITNQELKGTVKEKSLRDMKTDLVEKKQLEKNLEEFKGQINNIRDDIKNLDTSVDKIITKRDVTEDDFDNIKNDVKKIKENLILKKEVEKILESGTKKHQVLREEIDDVQVKVEKIIDNFENSLKGVDLKKIATSKEVDDIKKKIKELDDNTDEIITQRSIIDKDLSVLKRELESLKDMIIPKNEINKIIESGTKKQQRLREDFDDIDMRLNSISSDFNKKFGDADSEDLNKNAKELRNIQKKIESVSSNVSAISFKEKDLIKVMRDLDNMKRDMSDRITRKEINRELETLTSKVSTLKSDIDNIERDIKTSVRRLSNNAKTIRNRKKK
ncbi:MAG: hypothetical protein ABIG89_00345 [Candidatus Woesearchaeota archaeon]